MSRIAIVKIRSKFDLEWQPSEALKTLLAAVGARDILARLEGVKGLPFMPQLTLPYLAALGEAYNLETGARHTFDIFDKPTAALDLHGYDMVWFTVSTPTAPEAYRVSDSLRASGVPTVIGGIHATLMPDEVAAHATSVAVGEAEGIVGDLLGDFDSGRPLEPRYTGGRSNELAGRPIPRWEGYFPWMVPVETSRGCRNACHFCSTTRVQGHRRRHRPVEEVVAEIRALQESGVLTPVKSIFFTDNNIVSDSDHRRGIHDTRYARELFQALAPLGVSWVGQGEVSVGDDPELVSLMAESGCFTLLVGLESVDPRSLVAAGKGRVNAVERYVKAIATLHRHGVAIVGCFILGLDGDTEEVFETTRRFIDRWVDIPQVTLLTPFPGTGLYKRMKREGRILHEDWSRYDVNHVVFEPAGMSPSALEQGYRRLVERIYDPLAIWKRVLRYTFSPTVNGLPRFGLVEKVASILAPNAIYGRLLLGDRSPQRASWIPTPSTAARAMARGAQARLVLAARGLSLF